MTKIIMTDEDLYDHIRQIAYNASRICGCDDWMLVQIVRTAEEVMDQLVTERGIMRELVKDLPHGSSIEITQRHVEEAAK